MPQLSIIQYGAWSGQVPVADEAGLKVKSTKRKSSREATFKKGALSKADERARFTNPTLTFSMEVEPTATTGFAALGVGRTATLAGNFTAIWREHNPAEGIVILLDVDDNAEVESDEPLTSTMTFVHKPFIQAA